MKQILVFLAVAILFFVAGSRFSVARQIQDPGYVLEHEKDIAAAEPGSHDGGGNTTAYKFFAKVKDTRLEFRTRALHPGSAIGYHLQKEEEIYYIDSGKGEMQMNGKTFPVEAGDAVLTLPGSSHGLKQVGNEDLVVVIVYERKQ